jgi:membrane protein implicated in regulation of membrane protease activity
MMLHVVSVGSWTDLFYTRGAAECWLAVALVLIGCSLAANAGTGSCRCGEIPGFASMCCSGAEIFFLGVFLFFFIWSIVHSLIFYPMLYQRVVLDYRSDHTSKEVVGRIVEIEHIPDDDGGGYNLTIRYKRRGNRFQILYEDAPIRRKEGDRIPLRVLREKARSAIPAEAIGDDFWNADSLRWTCPLLTFILFGGLPALLFYINYPWPCFVFCLTFSLPAAAILSRRRIMDVTSQVYNNATSVTVEEFVVLDEDSEGPEGDAAERDWDRDLEKHTDDKDDKEDVATVEPSLGSCLTHEIELRRIT